ncbi:hypothetical protein BD779DRAFT_751656 [Infundibulicybe gibba]|nr:hypothetical protein BD779DRAFT_751656 [Infundibulicybe gibba]
MPCQNCSCPSCLAHMGSSIPPTELPLPPSELMTTNRAATDAEVAQSRNVIDSAEEKISLIQAAMADLAERIANTRRVIETHRTAISPLKAFPPELLVATFTEYLTVVGDPRSEPAPPNSPLTLMWVCSRWRAIVLDTPRFWTRISDSTPMVDLWLNQSRDLPLDLHFDLSSGDASDLDALISQAHRWGQVHFTLQTDSNSILSPVRGHLHSLKRLELSRLYTNNTLDFCEQAPQLTEIQLGNVPNPPAIKLPWEQLRNCTLGGSMITLYALQQARNIQTCHFKGMNEYVPWASSPMPMPHICHSRLETLIISRWHSRDFHIRFFFSSLTLPSLQTFELYFPNVVEGFPTGLAHTLSGFFKRSAQRLTVLKLARIPFPPNDVINWLTLMPSLVSFCVKFLYEGDHYIDDNFLGRLSFDHTNRLLPCLNSLSLLGQSSFDEISLHDLIASRRDVTLQDAGVALLTTIFLDCDPPCDWCRCELPSFHRFASEGLEITYGADWNIRLSAMDVTSDRSSVF